DPRRTGLQLALPPFIRFGATLDLVERRDQFLLGEMERVARGQRRKQLALVGTVVEDRHFRGLVRGVELPPGIAVSYSDGERPFGGAARTARHTDPSPDQGPQHGEEAPVVAVDRAGVRAVHSDVAEGVEQITARIGRASCREREWSAVVAGGREGKTTEE